MKKKHNYSLTSAQRKELKKKQAIKDGTHVIEAEAPLTDDQIAINNAQGAQKLKKQSFIMKVACLCFAVVLALGLIASGIIIGIGTTRHNNFGLLDGAIVNPVATIHLSNNQQVEIELFFYKNPVITSNFIWLALNNFFNGTIFHNNQGGFVAFSGFESGTRHRAEDQDFVAGMSGFHTNRQTIYGANNFKLGFRLNANTAPQPHQTISNPRPRALNLMPLDINGDYAPSGWIAMMAGEHDTAGSSTSFVMIHDNHPDFRISRRNNDGQPDRPTVLMNARQHPTPVLNSLNSLSYFGRLTDASIEVIRGIAQRDSNRFNPSVNRQNWINNFFYVPSIYIREISFRQLDRQLRNRIRDDFESFVLESRHEINNPDALGGLTGRWSRSEQAWWNDNRLQAAA